MVIASLVCLALLAGGTYVFSQSGSDDNLSTNGTNSTTSTTDTTAPRSGPKDPPAVEAGALPLGSVTVTAEPAPGPCTANEECTAISVECPSISPATAVFGVGEPSGTPKGVLMFFSGGSGDTWFDLTPDGVALLADLQADGYKVIQVKWDVAWSTVEKGENVGFHSAGCRSATVIKYLHDTYYSPLALSPDVGVCGFCVGGLSSGSSQLGFSLAFYGMAPYIDAAILMGGPPHAQISGACLSNDPALAFDDQQRKDVDALYGSRASGPCQTRDESARAMFDADSIDLGGTFYNYPTTRVVFIFADKDNTVAVAHGQYYVDKLKESGSPMVEVVQYAGGHLIQQSEEGLRDLDEALRGSP